MTGWDCIPQGGGGAVLYHRGRGSSFMNLFVAPNNLSRSINSKDTSLIDIFYLFRCENVNRRLALTGHVTQFP
jgi:hypothetical protein